MTACGNRGQQPGGRRSILRIDLEERLTIGSAEARMALVYLSRSAYMAECARQQAQKTGFVAGRLVWTDAEIALLLKNYPNWEVLSELLPRRSSRACMAKAQALGIVEHKRAWTTVELSRLRRLYPTSNREGLELAFPGRTHGAIAACAARLGVSKKRKPYALVGRPVIDEIRRRCRSLNYTMRDLDALAKTKTYFRGRHWRRVARTTAAMTKAVLALDGDLQIQWTER